VVLENDILIVDLICLKKTNMLFQIVMLNGVEQFGSQTMLEEQKGGPQCNYLNPSRQSASMMKKGI
jgi:hypothetical protein